MTREDIYRIALPAALTGIAATLAIVIFTIWSPPPGPDTDGMPRQIQLMLTVGFTSLALTGIALITKK